MVHKSMHLLVNDNLVKVNRFIAFRTSPPGFGSLVHVQKAAGVKALNVIAMTAANRKIQPLS